MERELVEIVECQRCGREWRRYTGDAEIIACPDCPPLCTWRGIGPAYTPGESRLAERQRIYGLLPGETPAAPERGASRVHDAEVRPLCPSCGAGETRRSDGVWRCTSCTR